MPLNYRTRGPAGTQLDVVSGTAIVGRLWKAVMSHMADEDARWSWTWDSGPALTQRHGTANSIEEAKAKLEEQWRAWLEAAGLTEK